MTKYFEVAELTGIPIYQAPDRMNAEACRVRVGSILEIVEVKDSCEFFSLVTTRRGRLADGRGWITISRGDEAHAHECMRPFVAGAEVIPGAIISGAALF